MMSIRTWNRKDDSFKHQFPVDDIIIEYVVFIISQNSLIFSFFRFSSTIHHVSPMTNEVVDYANR